MNFLESGNPMRIKICGVTSSADAEMAVAAGADALGFNFYRGSKRCILFEESRAWINSLSGRAFRVAVVVNAGMDELHTLRDSGCFEAVQFHGDETPEFCARAGFSAWIRAVRVKCKASLREALRYDTSYLLLDAWSEAAYGGTGRRLDWDLMREFVADVRGEGYTGYPTFHDGWVANVIIDIVRSGQGWTALAEGSR